MRHTWVVLLVVGSLLGGCAGSPPLLPAVSLLPLDPAWARDLVSTVPHAGEIVRHDEGHPLLPWAVAPHPVCGVGVYERAALDV